MKRYLLILFCLASFSMYGQVIFELTSFNKLVDVKGSDYMIALEVNTNSLGDVNSMSIMFINTVTGEGKIADIAKEYIIQDFKQVKIDSLEINTVLVTVRMFDLDLNGRINAKDPITLVSVGVNGEKKEIITSKNFSVRVWEVNEKNGTVVISGYYDNDRNGRYDPYEKNEILIYDLKTYKLLYKIK